MNEQLRFCEGCGCQSFNLKSRFDPQCGALYLCVGCFDNVEYWSGKCCGGAV